MVGDLAASAIKRNHDIKDYGKLIPDMAELWIDLTVLFMWHLLFGFYYRFFKETI